MKKDKILLNISNIKDIKTYKKLGVTNFLFPLENFSIGYKEFTLKEIEDTKVTCYLLINRLLTDEDIDSFLTLQLPNNIKGLIIEDIGLYYELKDSNLELINFQNHLNNNYKTINYWLKRFDSLVLSTDITFEETEEILNKTTKPLIVYTFGYPMIMYSRRHLVSNFYKHLNVEEKQEIKVTVPNNDLVLSLKETDYGTAIFDVNLLDARSEAIEYPNDSIKFYLMDTNNIDVEVIKKAITTSELLGEKGFLYKKTIYRIGDIK